MSTETFHNKTTQKDFPTTCNLLDQLMDLTTKWKRLISIKETLEVTNELGMGLFVRREWSTWRPIPINSI